MPVINDEKAVLVTGCSGFIGSQVVTRLAAEGRKVYATDVAPPRQQRVPGVEYYFADVRDIARHAPVVARHCSEIIHCGGISGPMLLGDNPAEVLDINIRGTSQLLSLASELEIRRFVSLSSVSAYGSTPSGLETVDETVPLTASTFYGTSKAASDLALQAFVQNLGLSAVALRIGWVYGPGRVTDAIIQPLVRSASGSAYRMDAGADHRIQFVHVDDVVSAIFCALEAPSLPRAAYNINGEALSVGRLFELVAAQLPSLSASVGPGMMPGTEIQGRMSIEAARQDLGWTPKIDFETGLRAYVDWLRHNPY